MDPTNAVCLPVPYDGDSGTYGSCYDTFGETYCCEVPAIDGENEYSSITYGTCQTVDTVSQNQKDGQLVTCGAKEMMSTVGALAVISLLF